MERRAAAYEPDDVSARQSRERRQRADDAEQRSDPDAERPSHELGVALRELDLQRSEAGAHALAQLGELDVDG